MDLESIRALSEIVGPTTLVGIIVIWLLKGQSSSPSKPSSSAKPEGLSAEAKLWIREEILTPILEAIAKR